MEVLFFSGGVILVSVLFVFLVAIPLKDNSIIDIAYGLIFVATALASFFLFSDHGPVSSLVTLLSILWGVRLSSRIFLKNLGKGEDARYAAWREAWKKKGSGYFLLRSLFQVYLLQGLVIWLVSLPVILVNATHGMAWDLFVTVGLVVWSIGFLLEALADWQLDRFLRRPENRGRIMTEGLFRYSRRPNYFGESLIWWGMAIIAFSEASNWIAFVSPLVITYIVVAVTGPITEALFEANDAYAEYKRRTSYFFPWPPLR